MQPATARNILLLMQADPIQEWQRLTGHYRQMSDEELLELGSDFSSLTETAQQVLRSEMKGRGLGDPAAPEATPPLYVRPERAIARIEPEPGPENSAFPLGGLGVMPRLVPNAPETENEGDGPHEYTWKTALSDCDSNEEAQELSRALKRAGLDSWIQQPMEFGRQYARVLVAADQLDQARVIAAQSLPQGTVEDEKRGSAGVHRAQMPGMRRRGSSSRSCGPGKHLALRAMRQGMDGVAPECNPGGVCLSRNPPKRGKSRPATGQLSPLGE